MRNLNLFVVTLMLSIGSFCVGAEGTAGKQLLNLPKVDKARFKITDRVWPVNSGEADVCLWQDDKLCAVSYTIDDNNQPDHAWWIKQGNKYGFKFTWFVITERAGTGGFWGTWDDFKKLKDLGHDVQSHSVTHLHIGEDGHDSRIKSVDDEYKISKQDIETNIPENECITLAYPGGSTKFTNDTELAKEYYIAARGTVGHINKANKIDYMQTSSLGNGINIGEGGPWSQFATLLDPSLYNGRNYRGWCCTHFHSVKEELRAETIKQFELLKSRADDVWVGLFREVVLYGQERDTAILNVVSSSDKEIKISVSDDMDDTLFTYPLTVKVRLPGDWKTVVAKQSSKNVKAEIIEHDGKPYALVAVVPDKGEVVISK